MRKVSLLAIIATTVAAAQAGTIYNGMGIIPNGYNTAYGNHEGGIAIFGKNYGLELGQEFYTTTSEFILTELEVANLTFGVAQPTNAIVSIYNWDAVNNKPDENPLFRGTVPISKNTSFSDSIFGLVGVRSTISGLSISLSPSTHYVLSIQTIDADWAYTAVGPGKGLWVRDHSSFGYQGGWGFTTWRPKEGMAAYRIEAIPEPTALVLLVLGAFGLIPRR
jgi:hypothetical protein